MSVLDKSVSLFVYPDSQNFDISNALVYISKILIKYGIPSPYLVTDSILKFDPQEKNLVENLSKASDEINDNTASGFSVGLGVSISQQSIYSLSKSIGDAITQFTSIKTAFQKPEVDPLVPPETEPPTEPGPIIPILPEPEPIIPILPEPEPIIPILPEPEPVIPILPEPGPIIPILPEPEPIIPILPEPEPIIPILPEPEQAIPISELPKYNSDQRLIVEITFVSTPFLSAEEAHNNFWGTNGDALYDTFTFWGHPGELNLLENDNPNRWSLIFMVMPNNIQAVYDFVKNRVESSDLQGAKVYIKITPTPPRNIVSQAGKRCTMAVGIVNDPITGLPRPYRNGCFRNQILAETDLPKEEWSSDVFMNVLYIDPKGFYISGNEYMNPNINYNPTLITLEITPKDETTSQSPRTFQMIVLKNDFPEIYSEWQKLPIKKVALNRFNNRTQIYRMDFSSDVESLVYTIQQMINESPSMPYTAEVTYL